MGSVCVLCVCECLQPVCKCVCVCVSLLDHFLWLWRWTGKGEEFFFFFVSGYLGVVDSIPTSLPITVGAFWKEREFEPGRWVRRLRCITSATNHMLGSKCGVRCCCWWSGPFRWPQNYILFVLGGNSRDCWACLCFCEPDPVVFLTRSSKHVIVLKQMRGWNGTRQTRRALLSG